MERFVILISRTIFFVSILLLPFLGIGLVYGLAGATSRHILLIGAGYSGVIFFSRAGIENARKFPYVLVSLAFMGTGLMLDHNFWSTHNERLCRDLRADASCVESACGFYCSDFEGAGGFATGGSICEDKDESLCKQELTSKSGQHQ